MSEIPKVSVIIPVYKTEKLLQTTIESVLGQTFGDFEIICVNDGSPDNSAEVLEALARKDDRVRIITQANGGLAAARNSGLGAARGRFVVSSIPMTHCRQVRLR